MEVEIKLVCKNLSSLRKKLSKTAAVLMKTKRQIDTYYDHPAKVLVENGEYLRVRRAGDKKTIAHHINLADGVNDECEIEMPAGAEIEKLLKRLGFPKMGAIDKKTRTVSIGRF
ncbi:CYTH domain-containing protein [Patescibacteria group bacterium]|nr:CYTH domain-containing protein [Patescibacteria group bacterium]